MDRREALKAGLRLVAVVAPTRLIADPVASLPAAVYAKPMTAAEKAAFIAGWKAAALRRAEVGPGELMPRVCYSVKAMHNGEHGRGHFVDATGQKIDKVRAGNILTGKCSVREGRGWVIKVFPAPLQWVPMEVAT